MAEQESTSPESSDKEKITTLLDPNNKTHQELLKQVKSGEAKALFMQVPEKVFKDDNEELCIFKVVTDDQAFLMGVPFDVYFELVSQLRFDSSKMGQNAEQVTMEQRMKDAAPYNVFFNKLIHVPEIDDRLDSIRFTDLLCPSLGKLKSSFHINFMVDIFWLLKNYATRKLHKLPMTIIHGYKGIEWPKPQTMKRLYPNIDYYMNKLGEEHVLGCHHTKLSIFLYDDDSMRLVIGSANLYAEDWDVYNEQLWISPRCPKLPEGASSLAGESPTGFKMFLLDYLFAYKHQNVHSLMQWIDRVRAVDFSEIKVALVYTVPGVHYPRKNGSLIHYLGYILSRDCVIPAPREEHDSWRIVAQTASLGLIGENPEIWLTTNFLKSLGSHKQCTYLSTIFVKSNVLFNLIYPTMENCLDGYLGHRSASCCCYEIGVKEKQPWLLKYKWSYEMGVLFLPKYFGEEYFETMEYSNRKNQRLFPMMFDLPLTPYGPDDESYCAEELFNRLGLNDNSESEHETEDKAKSNDIENKEQSANNIVENEKLDTASATVPSNKKDMKYSDKPKYNSFFPTFNRN